MSSIMQDFKYAVRTFRKTPVFTAVAVLTLALGIGANSSIFSVVNAVLLRPLPYTNGEQLAVIWGEMRNRNVMHFPSSPPTIQDFRALAAFDGVAGVFSFSQTLTGLDRPEQVQVGGVTIDFFSILGTQPMVGRGFNPEDAEPFNFGDQTATPPTNSIVLNHGFWQRAFGADPNVLGRSLDIGGFSAVIVGVMPPEFELLLPPMASLDTDIDIWSAARVDFENAPRANVAFIPIARLRPGVTVAQAQGELDALDTRLRADYQIYESTDYHSRVELLHSDLTSEVRPVMLALLGAVGFVLLIACVNVANLLLVRATTRIREVSIRAALGGSRAQLIRQMLSESLILSLMGGALGLLVAQGGIRVLLALRPADLPRIDTVSIDGTVLGFTLLSSLIAAVLFGTLPALHGSNPNLADALKGRGDSSQSAVHRRLRGAMVVFEVALSLVLLIGAGLMVRSFIQLTRVEPGYNAENLLTFRLPLPFGKYPQASDRELFHRQLRQNLAAIPGVQSVSAAFPLPLDGRAFGSRYGTPETVNDPSAFKQATYRLVSPGYFDVMQTRVLDGRPITEADGNDSLAVVVVDQTLAQLTWPNESPIGKQLYVRTIASTDPIPVEVVGVVEHQRATDLARVGQETVYFSNRFMGEFGGMGWVVRTGVEPLSLVNAVRREIEALDPSLAVTDMRLMDDYVKEARAPTRFALVLIGVFGLAALILASVGLYGVLSYLVRQRTSEIGIRMAFGAGRTQILKLVVGQGMVLALVGLGIGVVSAFGITRVMTSMLVDVAPTDPLTFVTISALFLLVALVACYLPASRATRVDPMVALRNE